MGNTTGRFRTDARNTKQQCITGVFYLYRKLFQMTQRPVTFRIDQFIEIGLGFR